MIYLNLKTSTLRAPEYIGSEPTQRGTWLNLMCYCCEQENGGTIEGCAGWKDRQWQQTAGVTLAEVREECDLWQWEGEALVVTFYPSDKEAEVQSRREAGRLGGKRSGKARRRSKNEAHLQANGEAHLEGVLEAHLERKGRERESKGIGKEEGEREKAEVTPALAKFVEAAKQIGVEPEIAEEVWHDNESRPITPHGQWTDYRGNPIANWRANLKARAAQIRARRGGVRYTVNGAANNGQRKPASVWELKQSIEAAQKEASRLEGDPQNKEPIDPAMPWDRRLKPSVASKVKELRGRAQELTSKLALLGKEAA